MHYWAKEILECVKEKAKAIGIDNFEGQNLDDLKDWTEIVKNIACFDKDYRIVEAMDKLQNDLPKRRKEIQDEAQAEIDRFNQSQEINPLLLINIVLKF